MATKPLLHDGMSWWQRIGAILWAGILIIAFCALLFGDYFFVNSSSGERSQHQGESDYEYHQRLQTEDQQDYRDCGYRPAC